MSDAAAWISAFAALGSAIAACGSVYASTKIYEATAKYVALTETLADSARKSVAAAERSAESSRVAALLQLAPLPVPWIKKDSGQVVVHNQGMRPAHNIEWKIDFGDGGPADGQHSQRVPPDRGSELQMTDTTRRALVDALKKQDYCVVVSLRYQAPWGQDFALERTYRRDEPHRIEVSDGAGEPLRLEVGSPEPTDPQVS